MSGQCSSTKSFLSHEETFLGMFGGRADYRSGRRLRPRTVIKCLRYGLKTRPARGIVGDFRYTPFSFEMIQDRKQVAGFDFVKVTIPKRREDVPFQTPAI